jgi:hypothetical protein
VADLNYIFQLLLLVRNAFVFFGTHVKFPLKRFTIRHIAYFKVYNNRLENLLSPHAFKLKWTNIDFTNTTQIYHI